MLARTLLVCFLFAPYTRSHPQGGVQVYPLPNLLHKKTDSNVSSHKQQFLFFAQIDVRKAFKWLGISIGLVDDGSGQNSKKGQTFFKIKIFQKKFTVKSAYFFKLYRIFVIFFLIWKNNFLQKKSHKSCKFLLKFFCPFYTVLEPGGQGHGIIMEVIYLLLLGPFCYIAINGQPTH